MLSTQRSPGRGCQIDVRHCAQHEVLSRTACSDSKMPFGGDEDDPFQGVCQGNGGSPATWLAASLVLVNMMNSEGHTAKMKSAFAGMLFSLIGLMFVDDANLFCTSECQSLRKLNLLWT